MKVIAIFAIFFSLANCQTIILNDIANVLSFIDLPENEICERQLDLMVKNLKNVSLDSWALRMIDAWSKIPSGLLSLNFGDLGSFEQCLETKVRESEMSFLGKYCIGTVRLTNTDISVQNNLVDVQLLQKQQLVREHSTNPVQVSMINGPAVIALCLPDGCTKDSAKIISDSILTRFLPNITNQISTSYTCQEQSDANPPLTIEAIVAISFFAIITAIMILSTIYDCYCKQYSVEPSSKLFVAFSIYSNGKKLFAVSNNNSNELSCLSGIRVISMAWVIFGHSAFGQFIKPLVNMIKLLQWIDSWHSMMFVAATLAVDSFLVVTGLLVVYLYMKSVVNNQKFNVLMFYFHRYIRLTPALAAAVLLNATLLKYFGSGPNWPFVSIYRQNFCKQSWWRALLYIQNYIGTEKICMTETWYLAIDMQIFLISPIFLIMLSKNRRAGVSLMGAAIVAVMTVSFVITWIYKVPALITNVNGSSADFNYKYYYTTHTRASTWFIGGITGYFISEIKLEGKKFKISQKLDLFIWILVIALFGVCIFSGHSTLRGAEYNRWGNALYNTFMRPAWGLCVSWVVFSCVTGNAAFVNWFLSTPLFQVLNRCAYGMYLLHLSPIYMMSLAYKSGAYFSMFSIFYQFWGNFAFSFGLAIYWVLAFESPILVIEKVLLRKQR